MLRVVITTFPRSNQYCVGTYKSGPSMLFNSKTTINPEIYRFFVHVTGPDY